MKMTSWSGGPYLIDIDATTPGKIYFQQPALDAVNGKAPTCGATMRRI